MNIKVNPSQLRGEVVAPPSKSDVHRAIICAALSRGRCELSPVALSNDIKATISCVSALGAFTEMKGDTLVVDGTDLLNKGKVTLDCGESGSTLRFFVPIVSALGLDGHFVGHGSLLSRPIGMFSTLLPSAGARCETSGTLPLSVSGQLRAGSFEVRGDVSSQFITGLLLALPLLEGDSEIVLTTPLQSEAYVDMTIHTMSRFGVEVEKTDFGYRVKGSQTYKPQSRKTDGDWSQAAFFLCAGAVSGDVTVRGVDLSSTQGDKEILSLLRRFGAKTETGDGFARAEKSELSAIEIDARQIPDLVPILAVTAAFAEGTTRIFGAERLRIKESDRLKTTRALLNSMGVSAKETEDGLLVTGGKIKGGLVDGSNDHRIVMSAAIAALGADSPTEITDTESINKSFPTFFEEYKKLGGIIRCPHSEQASD